jgi:hypothetical protein
MNVKQKLIGLVLGGIGLLAAGSAARAESIIVVFLGQLPVGQYNYNATVAEGASNSRVETGDFFTIYDFEGYNGVHGEPVDWAFSAQNLGINPPTIPLPISDNPFLPNLTWQYTGLTPIDAVASLGNFFAQSTVLTENPFGTYAGADHQEQLVGPFTGQYLPSGNNGFTTVPNSVPVPASAWAGLVLLGMVFAGRRAAKIWA